jgi:serine/threonine-protein kinase
VGDVTLNRLQLDAALPGYEIGEELGQAAFGVDLGGVHRRLGRAVAIKQLSAGSALVGEIQSRFVSEAMVLASMDHPHIVPSFDFVEFDNVYLFVMERLPGGTLWDRMSEGSIDFRFACEAALSAAAGPSYAPRHDVLHRDIKTENLMLSADGVSKVTDFGTAKVVSGDAAAATVAGSGTSGYMAPEQAQGHPVSPATDVYGLGTVLSRWCRAGCHTQRQRTICLRVRRGSCRLVGFAQGSR